MTANDVLWHVNNEYRKRLNQAEMRLNLLEQLILTHNGERHSHLLAALSYAREQVGALAEEHRRWRYSFYYESADSKRMVQSDRQINQALSRFSRMRMQHETRLRDLYTFLFDLPRPDPALTRVANGGDLWTLVEYALHDLMNFGSYLSEVSQVN